MLRRSKFLTMAAVLLLPLAACDQGDTSGLSDTGTIMGTVTIDGSGVPGMTVALSGGMITTTGPGGAFRWCPADS